MTFESMVFVTREQALSFFNKVARDSVAFLCKGNNVVPDRPAYFVFNETDYTKYYNEKDWGLDLTLELCSE